MPEPKHSNPPSQPPAPHGARSSNPLTEPKRGPLIPGEEKVKAALKEGDIGAIEEIGQRAKPVLFRIIQDTDEDFASRRFAADAVISLYGNNIRAYDRVLCLLLNENAVEAASLGDEAVIPAFNMLKNRKENPFLRGMAVDLLVSIDYGQDSRFTLSVVAAFSSLLSNEQEAPILRVKMAEEFPKLTKICDPAKMRLMRSALEKAAQGEDSCVASAAEDALAQINENSHTCIDDDNPTLRLEKKR